MTEQNRSDVNFYSTFGSRMILTVASMLTAIGPHQYLLIYLLIQPFLGFTKNEELDLAKHLFNRMFVLMMIGYTLLNVSYARGKLSLRSTGMEAVFGLYLSSVVLSTINAMAFGNAVISRSMTSLLTVPILMSLVYVVSFWINKHDMIVKAVRYFLYSVVVVCILGLIEFVMLGLTDGFGTERISSVFSDPNIFARYILLGIFFIVPFLFYRDDTLFSRRRLLIFLSLFLVNLLFSLSRSGYLTFIVGGILFSFFIESKRFRTAVIGSSIVFGIVIFAYLLTQRAFTGTAIIEPSNINRVLLILGGIDMIQTHWLIGTGYTNFANYFERHYLENALSLSSESYKLTGFATEIHSWVVEVWAEQGTIGLIIFIALFYRMFSLLNKSIRKEQDGPMRNILIGFYMAIFVFLFQGFFYHTFISQFFFWLMAGFAVAAMQISADRSGMGNNDHQTLR